MSAAVKLEPAVRMRQAMLLLSSARSSSLIRGRARSCSRCDARCRAAPTSRRSAADIRCGRCRRRSGTSLRGWSPSLDSATQSSRLAMRSWPLRPHPVASASTALAVRRIYAPTRSGEWCSARTLTFCSCRRISSHATRSRSPRSCLSNRPRCSNLYRAWFMRMRLRSLSLMRPCS